MKKKIIIIIISLLLIATAIAITLNNRSMTLPKTLETKAIELGIDIYNTTDYEKDGLYQRCLISLSNYNLPCSNYMNEILLDDWEKERITDILQVAINREEATLSTKTSEGQTTISS